MKWFVIDEDGLTFECDDDATGEQDVIKFIIERYDKWEQPKVIVIRGERKTYVPPSDMGKLV